MKYVRLLGLVCLVTAWGCLSASGAKSLLSSQEDTKDSDPTKAFRNSDEATAFWGLAGMLGGLREIKPVSLSTAESAVRMHARKPAQFYDAAFLIAVKGRGDVIASLAEGSSSSETALTAAAAISAAGELLQSEREANKVNVKHIGATGKAIGGGSKARKKGKGKKTLMGGADKAVAAALPKLLTSRDPLTLYLAIQAAAYAKDGSVSETIAAIAPANGKIAGAKLYYRAMRGEEITMDDVMAAANIAGSHGHRSGVELLFPISISIFRASVLCAKRSDRPGLRRPSPFWQKRPHGRISAYRSTRHVRWQNSVPRCACLRSIKPSRPPPGKFWLRCVERSA